MGAVYFSLDPKLVYALKQHLSLNIFVETGTFHGDTAATMASLFDRVYTIELSQDIFLQTAQRLGELQNVEMIRGSSPTVLRQLCGPLRSESVIYWLDAHWCGGQTSGTDYECPLLDELAAIGELNAKSVVLIDDARLFLAPPPAPHAVESWPMVTDVVRALLQLSTEHKLWIIDDVFVFAPQAAATDVVDYGRR